MRRSTAAIVSVSAVRYWRVQRATWRATLETINAGAQMVNQLAFIEGKRGSNRLGA